MNAAFSTFDEPMAWLIRGLVEYGWPDTSRRDRPRPPQAFGGMDLSRMPASQGRDGIRIEIPAVAQGQQLDEPYEFIIKTHSEGGAPRFFVRCVDCNYVQEFPFDPANPTWAAGFIHQSLTTHVPAFLEWRMQGGEMTWSERQGIPDIEGDPCSSALAQFIQSRIGQPATPMDQGPTQGWWQWSQPPLPQAVAAQPPSPVLASQPPAPAPMAATTPPLAAPPALPQPQAAHPPAMTPPGLPAMQGTAAPPALPSPQVQSPFAGGAIAVAGQGSEPMFKSAAALAAEAAAQARAEAQPGTSPVRMRALEICAFPGRLLDHAILGVAGTSAFLAIAIPATTMLASDIALSDHLGNTFLWLLWGGALAALAVPERRIASAFRNVQFESRLPLLFAGLGMPCLLYLCMFGFLFTLALGPSGWGALIRVGLLLFGALGVVGSAAGLWIVGLSIRAHRRPEVQAA
ncbi:MAG: hypothetical protein QGG40_09270, partial [Myxococcota bacterium]|nr:hypothetical protein [Myxococcota bacterium]